MGSPERVEEHQYPYLVKHDVSLYNASEHMFGKPLDNLDPQFFNGTAEAQIMQQNSSTSSSSSSSSSTPVLNNLNITLRTRNMVGEIWIDQVRTSAGNGMANMGGMSMTPLDEFIMGQDVLTSEVKEHDNGFIMPKIDPGISRWHQHEGMTMPVEPMLLESKCSVAENGFESNMMDAGYLEEELKNKTSAQLLAVADNSPDSPGQVENKSNFKDERIERKQKRKIKNRESAARSRAKKQAHTNRLEQSKLELQATNDLLQKRKETLLLLNSSSTSEPRYRLRRTSSSSF